MTNGIVNCGICGFSIQVEADCEDEQNVKLKITSKCPNYQKIAIELQEVDSYQELFQSLDSGRIHKTFDKYSPHKSCPGLSCILKTVEVAAGLALPQVVTMVIKKC